MTEDLTGFKKRELFEKKYYEKEQQKEADKQKKKIQKEDQLAPEEEMILIQKNFSQMEIGNINISDINKKLKQCFEKDFINNIEEDIEQMNRYFQQVNHALIFYDRQIYNQIIQKLKFSLQEIKIKLQPRKKFRFTRREKYEKNYQNKLFVKTESENESFLKDIPGPINLQNQNLVLNESNSIFKILNNNDCTLLIQGTFDCVYIKNNSNCTIKLGPVKSSVFIDNCQNCTFQIMAHQDSQNQLDIILYLFYELQYY